MNEIHLEENEKLKDLTEGEELIIYGELKIKAIQILRKLNIKHIDLNNLTNTLFFEKSFYKFESLISITLPKELIPIGDYCFYGCEKLEKFDAYECAQLAEFPNFFFFGYCRNLISVTLPKFLTIIKDFAFHSCIRLESIILPDSIIYIGNSAFSLCKSLKKSNSHRSLKK